MQLPQRHKKKKRLYHKDSSIIRLRPKYANHIWSIDFVHDRLSSGRKYKLLTVLDEYTREALCVVASYKMGSTEVLEALYPIMLKHGKPEFIRSDNGPEFASEAFQSWLKKVWRRTDPHLSGFTLGFEPNRVERIQRALQRNATPGSAKCGMVRINRAGKNCHPKMDKAVQSYPPASGARHASASP